MTRCPSSECEIQDEGASPSCMTTQAAQQQPLSRAVNVVLGRHAHPNLLPPRTGLSEHCRTSPYLVRSTTTLHGMGLLLIQDVYRRIDWPVSARVALISSDLQSGHAVETQEAVCES